MLFTCQFRDPTLRSDDFPEMLRRMHALTSLLAQKSEGMNQWFAQGETLEEAFFYPAFEFSEPSAALLAVLNHEYRQDKSFTSVSIWNGIEADGQGVSLALQVNNKGYPGKFELSYSDRQQVEFHQPDPVKEIISAIVSMFPPQYVSVSPPLYSRHQVFEDRPGAGWMLYLPRVITPQQIPEAQALIPLPAPGKKQTGTLIVSINNEIFSLANPRHIELANQIELRLVDQDLIDRYEDMYRSEG